MKLNDDQIWEGGKVRKYQDINFLRPWEGLDFSGSIDSDLHLFSQSSESDESERKSESLSSSTLTP